MKISRLIYSITLSDVRQYTDNGWIIKQIAPDKNGVYVVLEKEKED